MFHTHTKHMFCIHLIFSIVDISGTTRMMVNSDKMIFAIQYKDFDKEKSAILQFCMKSLVLKAEFYANITF
jgi:hypothetical protein